MPLDEASKQEVKDLITGAIKSPLEQLAGLATTVGELGKNVKIVADTLAAQPAGAAEKGEKGKGGKEGEAAKSLTLDDITKLLDARDTQRAGTEARQKFIGEKLKGVPAAYHGLLGNDPAKWPAEEQAIRAQLQTDLAGLGVKAGNVGGGAGGGAGAGGGGAGGNEIGDPEKLSTKEFADRFLPKVGAEVSRT
jgi:hypothetical protein